MRRLISIGFAALLVCAACGGEPRSEEPPPTDVTTVSDADVADRATLIAFLRRHGGTLADVDDATLDGVRAVRLNAAYETDELTLLEGLPNLREVMIWRDGERFAGDAPPAAPTDDDLRALATLHRVETLRLGGWAAPFTDAGIAHLVTMPALRRLDLIQAQGITDAAMDSVARMPALASLAITYTKISDDGLARLTTSETLTTVGYGWAAESERWLAAFRSAHADAPFTVE